MIRIRIAAIVFALVSAIYWAGCQYFFDLNLTRAIGQQFELPTIVVLWLPTVPILIYALTCLLFFHWLKRRLIKALTSRSEDNLNVH
jgi:hypothetical protein